MLILVNRKLNLTIEHLGSDEKGRFVFIRCKIYNNRLALVSIYGPNETDSAFLTQISKTLLEQIDCPLVVGGDFNAVVNPALDKSQSDTTANPSSKLLNTFITELSLIDLWRIQNTKSKDFTFFSNRHKTFSRIDYIFLSPSLILSNSSISILPILLSDHSAVLCSVPLSDVKAKSPRWRFNISLLSNQTFITSLKEYIKEFLEINMPSDWIQAIQSLSGYKINWSKSALMPINNVKVNSSIPSFIPIKESFIYLGITIYKNIHKIARDNFNNILVKVKNDIQRWRNLKVSFQGRISTIKMNFYLDLIFFVLYATNFSPSRLL